MENLLQQGITAYKSGKRDIARNIFMIILRENPNDERAWGWMYNVANNDKERIDCLKQIVRINPNNHKADELLNRISGFDYPLEPPPPSSASSVQAQATKDVSEQTSGLDSISIIIIVLLIILGLFWITIGLLQFGTASLGASSVDALCYGGWNILISIINLLGINDVIKRSKRVPREMLFLAIVGSIWGMFQLMSGAFLQVCAIPIYIALGVLANINKEAYKN